MASYTQVSYGSNGDAVKQLQTKLNAVGYSLDVDGAFGAKTQAAVKDYQSKNGLTVDGIAGNATWGKLDGSGAASQSAAAAGGLSGVSKNTQDNLNKYASGYKESDSVAAAQNYLKQLQDQKPGEYESKWTDQVNELYDKIMGRKDFNYDLSEDPLYQQYRDQFVNLGQNAMMDTMGQAAGLTGGYGSTYGQNAGQQAYQGYLQQLNDKVPELYRLALDKYDREGQQMMDQYGMALDRDATDYGRYRDDVADWQSERDFAQGQYDSERDFDYGKFADMLSYWQGQAQQENSDYWTKTQFEYQKEQDAIANALAQQRAASSGGGGGGSYRGKEDDKTDVYKYGGAVTKDGAMNESNFTAYMRSIVATAQSGNDQAVANRVESIYDSLSSEQKKTLKSTLSKYGYSL